MIAVLPRVSPATAFAIREHYPDDDVVYAVYDIDNLKRPSLPVCTYGQSEGWEAVDHARNRGEAVVLAVCPDGTVARYGPPPETATRSTLMRDFTTMPPDTFKLVVAVLEGERH